jgi:DNA/RNA endonuclease G (NUC1)
VQKRDKFWYLDRESDRFIKDDEFVAMYNGTSVYYVKADFDRGLVAVRIPKTCGSSDRNDCDRSAYIDTAGKLVFEF